MKQTKKIIIGIDPDIDKSGVAVLRLQTMELEVSSQTFGELIDFFRRGIYNPAETRVVVEASWTTAHNFHLLPSDSKAVSAKKSYHVGRNHQCGIDICKLAESEGLEVVKQPPLRKCWKGKDRKITHDEIRIFTPLKKKRTNQEERDAILLAWTNAGLPTATYYKFNINDFKKL